MNITDLTMTKEAENGFYPTPPDVAEKMLAGLDMTYIQSVLEPSAGKGDLVMALAKKFNRQIGYRSLEVDCIEIDPYLRQILKYNFSDERKQSLDGRNPVEYKAIENTDMRIVHDDFLTFRSRKHYDLILMNPPFADGDKHLLKALEIQEGGGMVICLLNAETLRNPYTFTRKELEKRLREMNAEITFIKDAFSDAERSADVDVAVVRVLIPEAKYESDIWERMKRAEDEYETPDAELNALIPGNYIEQAIRMYNTEVAATLELVKQWRALSPYIGRNIARDGGQDGGPMVELSVYGSGRYEGFDQRRYMREVRMKYWNALFNNPQFVGKLTSDLRKTFRENVDRMADYEFSAFNIRQVMAEMNVSIASGVEDAIMKLFDELSVDHSWYPECANNRHYYNGWATNKAHKVGKKCVVPTYGIFRQSYYDKQVEFELDKAYSVISDLEKALDYLGGKGPENYDLMERLKQAKEGSLRNVELKYFKVDFFKKGTIHIKFLPDTMPLVERLNIFASQKKGWLPPRYGKSAYTNMDAAEKDVVDSFHGDGSKGSGEKGYEKVMKNAAFYLSEPARSLPALTA